MNRVQGRVILKETGNGIPNLLVAAYDVDPKNFKAELLVPIMDNKTLMSWDKILTNRLGSVTTDANGAFTLDYDAGLLRGNNLLRGNSKRPSLAIFVLAPEDTGLSRADRVVYSPTELRDNAGTPETYLVSIPGEQLRKAGMIVGRSSTATKQLDGFLSYVRAVADQRAADNAKANKGKSFSQRYQERSQQWNKLVAGQRRQGVPNRGFAWTLPIALTEGVQSDQIKIANDPATNALNLIRAGQEPVRLQLTNVQDARSKASGLAVTPDGAQMTLTLQQPAINLRSLRSDRSNLYTWFQNQLRSANKNGAPEANKNGAPEA